MERPLVYVALQEFCRHDESPRALLRKAGFEVRENDRGRRLRREEMMEALQDADAVIAGVEPYDAQLMQALPRLKCLSRCGSGTDAIDLEAARRRGIAVFATTEETVEPVAQLTVAMILALARNLPLHARAAAEGRWEKRTGVVLAEWTIGLLGFGRIGRAVERSLRPFAPRVLVTDPNATPADVPEPAVLCPPDTLLEASDVVSLHAAVQQNEGPLIGRRELALMKPGSYLVNTARGHLVDEAALVEALRAGHLAGAALDVFAEEPYRGPLTSMPQVLCTPHVATLTTASRAAMELRAARHVVEWWQRTAAPGGVAAAAGR